jgi:hypothetical protein
MTGRRSTSEGRLADPVRWSTLRPAPQLVRLADQCSGFVIIALDDDEDRTATLATATIMQLSTWSGMVIAEPQPRRS